MSPESLCSAVVGLQFSREPSAFATASIEVAYGETYPTRSTIDQDVARKDGVGHDFALGPTTGTVVHPIAPLIGRFPVPDLFPGLCEQVADALGVKLTNRHASIRKEPDVAAKRDAAGIRSWTFITAQTRLEPAQIVLLAPAKGSAAESRRVLQLAIDVALDVSTVERGVERVAIGNDEVLRFGPAQLESIHGGVRVCQDAMNVDVPNRKYFH
jgi:hypothetical protein